MLLVMMRRQFSLHLRPPDGARQDKHCRHNTVGGKEVVLSFPRQTFMVLMTTFSKDSNKNVPCVNTLCFCCCVLLRVAVKVPLTVFIFYHCRVLGVR